MREDEEEAGMRRRRRKGETSGGGGRKRRYLQQEEYHPIPYPNYSPIHIPIISQSISQLYPNCTFFD
jgi:hypothetical protein